MGSDTEQHAPAAWERVAGGYAQCLDAVWPQVDYLPRALPAFLAEMFARLSARYHGKEEAYASEAWTTLTGVRQPLGLSEDRGEMYHDPLFADHPAYRPMSSQRRVPTPVEAAIETIRRLRDTRMIEEVLGDHSIGAILGGSVSYGRFINVKGGADSSDIDMLLLIRDWSKLRPLLSQLTHFQPVRVPDVEQALLRVDDFENYARSQPDRVAFSAKMTLWDHFEDPFLVGCGVESEYSLSIHVLTRPGLGRLLLEDAPMIASSVLGHDSVMFDYRESRPTRSDSQRGFSGKGVSIELQSERHGSSFTRETRIFFLDQNHSYFPGMFQNLVLPAFDVRWGDNELRRLVDSFRWKMVDRLRYEQREKPNQYLRLSLAHTRSEVFAPHTVRAVDASTQLA